MSARQVVILDGRRAADEDLAPMLAILIDELKSEGAEVRTFNLRESRIASCIGCFGCWVQTPGTCVLDDAGREIAGWIIRSDLTILFTSVTFGGYSSELKKMVDRWIPLTLPYFNKCHSEIHHRPRYSRYPKIVGIGVQRELNETEASIFRTLVGRNALNLHAPSYAAEVFLSTDNPDRIRQRFRTVLSNSDSFPLGKSLTALQPAPGITAARAESTGNRRALLIVGSPKIKQPSTSGVLGNYLLERLKERGWETESVTLRPKLHHEKGQSEFMSAVKRAGLLLFAFPLYVDALPSLMTKALEVIADHRKAFDEVEQQRLAVVCNNGFPEAHQNILALAICHQFALQNGIAWAGGLAMGAGEALSSGQSLTAKARAGRPTVRHVTRALDIAAAALAEGRPLPGEAIAMIARNPIPLVPSAVWHWMFVHFGSKGWQKQAAENGVSKERMTAKPYAE